MPSVDGIFYVSCLIKIYKSIGWITYVLNIAIYGCVSNLVP